MVYINMKMLHKHETLHARAVINIESTMYKWRGGVTEGGCCSRGIVMIKDYLSDTESTSNVFNMFYPPTICEM